MGPGLGWKTLEHVQGIRHMGSWYVSLKGTRRLLCSAFLAYHSDLLNNSTSWSASSCLYLLRPPGTLGAILSLRTWDRTHLVGE